MLTILHALLLLEAAIHSVSLQAAGRAPYDNWTAPQKGRVAIVLRGQSHRCRARDLGNGPVHRSPCCEAAVPTQKAATASLVNHVIKPLEARGNKVDVVVTDGECNLTASSIISQLGDRVLQCDQRDLPSPFPQNNNIRFALQTFKAALPGGSEEIAKSYDLVLLLRQDITWRKPIDQWQEANLWIFNFPSRCEKTPQERCINDVFHTMPGNLFPAFDEEVGTGECFHVPDASYCEGHPHCIWNSGHFCAPQMRKRMGEQKVGMITQWRPPTKVRDANEIWELYDAVQ